jgi:hypothetical protein
MDNQTTLAGVATESTPLFALTVQWYHVKALVRWFRMRRACAKWNADIPLIRAPRLTLAR